MARQVVLLTNTWQKLTTGVASFEIKREADSSLYINNTDSETAASKRSNAELQPTDQIFQTSDGEETWMKGEGWEIIIDADQIDV